MIVDLPLPRNMANTNRNQHWREKERQKKKYWALCSTLLTIGRLPKPPQMPPLKAVITCHVIVGNRMDFDNLLARLKWSIDWLVGNDYLRGDSPEHLEWGAMPTQETKRKESYRAIFTIEEAVDAERK